MFIHTTAGSQYDENGNFRRWWTNSSRENFVKRSKCLIDQYNNVTIFGQKVCRNKVLVLGKLILNRNFKRLLHNSQICITIWNSSLSQPLHVKFECIKCGINRFIISFNEPKFSNSLLCTVCYKNKRKSRNCLRTIFAIMYILYHSDEKLRNSLDLIRNMNEYDLDLNEFVLVFFVSGHLSLLMTCEFC